MNKRSIILYSITFIVIFLIDFGLLSYLSKSLDKDTYLFYINTINALPFFTSLIGFGTPFAITYLASLQPRNAYKFLTESNTLAIFVIASILIVFSPLTYFSIIPSYLLISAIIGFFFVVKQNSVSYFLALKLLDSASYTRLNQKIIFSFVLICFINIVAIDSVGIFSIGLIAGEVIGLILLQIKYKILKFTKFTKIKSIIIISKYHFLAAAIASFSLATPVFILNLYNIEASVIASFAISLQVLKYFTLIIAPFMQLIIPLFTPMKNDQEKVKSTYFLILGIISLLGFFSALALYFSSELIANRFFSSEYSETVTFLHIFSWSLPFIMTSSYSGTILASIGGIKNVLSINTIMLVCMMFMSTTLHIISIEKYAMLIIFYYIIYFFVVQIYLQNRIKNIKPVNNFLSR